MSPKLFSGPHGTAIEKIATDIDDQELARANNFLDHGQYWNILRKVHADYLVAGVKLLTTHTFGERTHLNSGPTTDEKIEKFRDAFHRKVAVAREALAASKRTDKHDIELAICLGLKDNHADPTQAPDAQEAEEFHRLQLAEASSANPNLVIFETVNTIREAVGIAEAARNHTQPGNSHRTNVPVSISFIIDEYGRLLSGESPQDAVRAVDAASNRTPIGYGFNCCPIEGLASAFAQLDDGTRSRIISLHPNASSYPVAELDGLGTTTGQIRGLLDPDGVARYLNGLAQRYRLQYISGCCGFDHDSVKRIGEAIKKDEIQDELPLTDRARDETQSAIDRLNARTDHDKLSEKSTTPFHSYRV